MKICCLRGLIVLLLFIICVSLNIPINTVIQAQDSTPIAQDKIVKDTLGFEMIYVPSGSLEMGVSISQFEQLYSEQFQTDPKSVTSIEGETGIFDAYVATVAAFWIDRYEVTIEQYQSLMEQCMKQGRCKTIDLNYAPNLIDSSNKPQVAVPWYDALMFCSIRGARLPTEEEWEYAASGPENHIFPWGNELITDNVDVDGSYPVGSKRGNISWIGVYDMAGNAAEWVENRYKPYISASPFWPQNAKYEVERVIRGGSWDYGYPSMTTFSRQEANPDTQSSNIGFRCARTSNPS